MSTNQVTHKEDLLRQIQAEHTALAETVGALSPAQLTAPGVYRDGNGEWTVKDILCHLIWWEQSVFGWLGAAVAVPRSSMPEGEFTDDEANQIIFDANKDRPLATVLDDFQRSHAALVQALEAASDEQLSQPRAADPGSSPIYELVPGNTYQHYREHNASIHAWLTS